MLKEQVGLEKSAAELGCLSCGEKVRRSQKRSRSRRHARDVNDLDSEKEASSSMKDEIRRHDGFPSREPSKNEKCVLNVWSWEL